MVIRVLQPAPYSEGTKCKLTRRFSKRTIPDRYATMLSSDALNKALLTTFDSVFNEVFLV